MPPEKLVPFQPLSESSSTPTPRAELKIGKFKASKVIVQESWALLKQDKEIMWFPLLSAITSLIALVIMGVLFFFFVMGGNIYAFEGNSDKVNTVLMYIFPIIYYTVMFFIIHFFQAGMYIIAHGRMHGNDLSFNDGIHGAQEIIGNIFLWSLISATVGVILQLIAERSKLIGKIVIALLGSAWNILTYFSLPSLVIGKVSVKDSFKMSADTIRKTWGETIIVALGTGLFFSLILVAGIALGITIVIFVPTIVVLVAVVCLLFLFVLAVAIVSSSLEAIFKIALFEYARTGVVPKGFSPELIHNAIKK